MINLFDTQTFKGYDAAPLKRLYMRGFDSRDHIDVFNELKNISEKENFELVCIQDDSIKAHPEPELDRDSFPWNQDCMLLHKSNDKTYLYNLFKSYYAHDRFLDLDKTGITIAGKDFPIDGGNFFIGKNQKGEEWLLIGSDDSSSSMSLAKELGIKDENVFVLPQPAFHLDMRIRPVGYPYILVSDEDISLNNCDKLGNEIDKPIVKKAYNYLNKKHSPNMSGTEIAEKLTKFGFKPILIGGNYSPMINFMNAIVHQRPDGKLVYITNSSQNIEKGQEKYEKQFEQDLKTSVPNLEKVYFISGNNSNVNNYNCMANFLLSQGGIHCLCAEEPNFDKWA